MQAYIDAISAHLDPVRAELRAGTYSDLRDGEGHQYVDLVQEGGGMLGIALLGYTHVLEECGLRFWSLGGTSAGAINTMALAGLGRRHEAKSLRALQHLSALDTSRFTDGHPKVTQTIQYALANGLGLNTATLKHFVDFDISRFFDGFQLSDIVHGAWIEAYKKMGLNPGNAFTLWMTSILASAQISELGQLQERFDEVPEGMTLANGSTFDPSKFPRKLKLVAAELTTQSKVIFPEHAPLFWANSHQLPPAILVRASMSIPFFFEPLHLAQLPTSSLEEWKKLGYKGSQAPTEALFVDGGVISNFPINLFHSPGVPEFPTFGVKLGFDRVETKKIKSPPEMLSTIFEQAKNSLDDDFLMQNPDYEKLVKCIDTGAHDWLNFAMTTEAKVDLFRRGALAAIDFLKGFDWKAYKDVREKLAAIPVSSPPKQPISK